MLYFIGEMGRKHLGILYPVIMISMGVALAFSSAAFGAGLRFDPDASASFTVRAANNGGTPVRDGSTSLGAAALSRAATPTAQAVSHAGSTDGIVWLGFIIVAIVLLPILLRRGIWTK